MKKKVIIFKEKVIFQETQFSKKINATDCLGNQLYTWDLVALGSVNKIYMIIKIFEGYFLHKIDENNINTNCENLLKEILENELLPFDPNIENIYKVFLIHENEFLKPNPVEPTKKVETLIKKNRQKMSEKRKEYRAKNWEKISAQEKEYRAEHRAEISEKQKEYREKNKKEISERSKEYYLENKEIIQPKQAEYRLKNKDKINEKRRKTYQKNKEAILQKNAEYKEKNKEILLPKQAEYRKKNLLTKNC